MLDTIPNFSYTDQHDPILKKCIIRIIEWITGKNLLKSRYLKAQLFVKEKGWNFWEAALQALEIKLNYSHLTLSNLPKQGPLVVVANHPFGILDGIIICHLIEKIRPDFKILTNSMLCQAEEMSPYLLPIDFSQTKEAMQLNLQSRKEALLHLKEKGTIILFPAGGVSTTVGYRGKATDSEWKTFTASLIQQSGANVVSIYFQGQNSRLFQWVSQFSLTLRLSLLIREACNKIGKEINIHIGDTIFYPSIAHLKDRKVLTNYLREFTYNLSRPKTKA